MIRLFAAVLFCVSVSAHADWTRVATTLDQLNTQVLDWAVEYEALDGDGSAALDLHFKRGPVVAAGMAALQASWAAASETQKKSRYLAVTRYFATHSDDWGSSTAWAWYRCFMPPLDDRYNQLAEAGGAPRVTFSLQTIVPPDRPNSWVERSLPVIRGFLSTYGYPIVDTPITRISFDEQGLLVDGRPPRDRGMLNKLFTYSGGLITLFGPGF